MSQHKDEIIMPESLPPPNKRVVEFLQRVKSRQGGRVIFVVDATGSRERAWDLAAKLQADMFQEAAALGSLDLQLLYFHGTPGVDGECKASPWMSDGQAMARLMATVRCRTGPTQIQKALQHIKAEHQREPVTAAIYVGDMCEEQAQIIFDTAAGLSGVPLFVFGEGDDPFATPIFRQMARLTNGAYARFDPGAVVQLRELLRAVAAFATGGLTGLGDLKGDAGRKLLGQMKK